MITLRGQILVSRIGDDPPSAPVCPSKTLSVFTFKTFPCVLAPSPHVSYMWAWCRHTRGRFESTHGKRFERDKTRRQEKRREEMKKKREEEERRRREKKKREEERDNEQRQTIFSRMSASARFIFTPKSGECPAAPELFSPNVRDVRQHRN